jgi:hypothetical protein
VPCFARPRSEDAPQKDVRRCVDTVHELNAAAVCRDRDAEGQGRSARVCQSAQDEGTEPARGWLLRLTTLHSDWSLTVAREASPADAWCR